MGELQEKAFPNLLLIAGTGRNSGKTSFACHICEGWEDSRPLVCIKISNHYHWMPGAERTYTSERFNIYEETMAAPGKDTQRMLLAGASKVLFIEADREFVYPAFQKALETIPNNAAIICESGTLRRYIKPALFLMLHTLGTEPKEQSKDLLEMADKIFYFEPGNIKLPEKPVVFANHTWMLNGLD